MRFFAQLMSLNAVRGYLIVYALCQPVLGHAQSCNTISNTHLIITVTRQVETVERQAGFA